MYPAPRCRSCSTGWARCPRTRSPCWPRASPGADGHPPGGGHPPRPEARTNIIVAEDGPRVIDFGIARALDGTALTQTGFQIGTLGFLSPEQLTGGTLPPAVDMFALGVVLCRAAGRAPFGDGVSAAWPYRVVHEQPDLTDVPAS
ncbi:protein kinase domain-containing protein [Streptomyces sp. L7]